MNTFAKKAIALAVLSVSVSAASADRAEAHSSWILADPSRSGTRQVVRVVFGTADDFPNSEVATKPDRIASWVAAHGSDTVTLPEATIEARELVTRFQPPDDGLYVIGAALRPRFIELEAKKFEEYLIEVDATAALARRKSNRRGASAGREEYAKFAKTLLRVGGSPDGAGYSRPLGHPLEIVPLSNPAGWGAHDEVLVKVLLEGRPKAGFPVWLDRPGKAREGKEHATTDKDGIARLTLEDQGLYLARSYLIRPIAHPTTASEQGVKPDWQSFWASMSFAVGDESPIDSAIHAVQSIHGGAGPWVVAGYRMGERALKDLALPVGSSDLEVVHESPKKVEYSCIADGVQAATGASLGKLNLALVETTPEKLRTVFRRRSTGKTVAIELSDRFRKMMKDVPGPELLQRAREVAAMPDEAIMRVRSDASDAR